MNYHKLYETWNKVIKEEVYSSDMHSFIQYAYEVDELPLTVFNKKWKLQKFLDEYFTLLGSGIERLVYQTNTGEVVKLARNTEGIRSNKKEIEIFNRPDIEVFPRILASDDRNYLWYIVEKVTPIGKENTVEKYEKLFPKFYTLYKNFRDKHGLKAESGIDFVMYPLLYLVRFVYSKKNDIVKDSLDSIVGTIFRFSRYDKDYSIMHKEAVEILLEYFSDPDLNMKRLFRGVIDADVNPNDLHYNNLAYDENWNIKIIDAG